MLTDISDKARRVPESSDSDGSDDDSDEDYNMDGDEDGSADGDAIAEGLPVGVQKMQAPSYMTACDD